VLDIPTVLARTYEAGGYAERLNYALPCVPPLSPEEQAWADTLIHQATTCRAYPLAFACLVRNTP
jgi:hypothetical protein